MPKKRLKSFGKGIPALAGCTLEYESEQTRTLHFKHNERLRQASIYLVYPVKLKDTVNTDFIIEYNSENLNNINLSNATLMLPNELFRRGTPDKKTLKLALKSSCAIWCPHIEGLIEPHPDDNERFRELVSLAESTEVYITFDYSWIHRDNRPTFCSFVENKFERFPLESHYPGYQKMDKTIISMRQLPLSTCSREQYYRDFEPICKGDGASAEAPPPYILSSEFLDLGKPFIQLTKIQREL